MGPIGYIVSFLFSWTGLTLCSIFTALYMWGTYRNLVFERRGVPHLKPTLFFGHTFRMFMRRESFIETFLRNYNAFPDAIVSGFMQTTTPMFFVRDPELIKEITVKNFEHFRNHLLSNDPNIDPIFGRSIFAMKDQKWKIIRNLLSPGFTGSKMRIMFNLMKDCANKTVKVLEQKCESSGENGLEIEMKEFFTRFANDTIATTIFGIEVNSVEEPENEFYKTGKVLTTFGPAASAKFLLSLIAPWTFKLFGIRILDKKASAYFVNLVKKTIQYRIDNNIVRPDILNLYIESLKDEKFAEKALNNEYAVKVEGEIPKAWDLEEFVIQTILFFFAGFETTATFFMFVAYELAVNPDVQQKLLDEIDEVSASNGKSGFNYETLHSLKYLDMVVNETARRWPITAGLDRVCNKDITLTGSNGKSFSFRQGDVISIPSFCIQRDPAYYEDPEKFLPERFAAETKDQINPFTNLIFGIGPRMCIGNRFALTECKCIFYTLLSKFKLEMYEKTQHPIKFKKGGFAFAPEKGAWLKLVQRKQSTAL